MRRRLAAGVASALRFGGDPFVDHEARQVGQAGGDARLAAGALRNAPAHPFRGGRRDGVREARAVMHLAIHAIREVAPVAAVEEGADRGGILRRISAAQIEGAVIGQVRALLRQPEVVAGGWLAARQEAPDLSEEDARDALARLDPLWEELFPAEQQRIIHALVDRVVVGPTGADIRLRVEGLGSLARGLGRGGHAA